MSTTDLTGRTFFITGANAGIGRATASALVARGGAVVIASRSEEKTRPVLDELRSQHPGADCVSFAEAMKRVPDLAVLKEGDAEKTKALADSVSTWTAELAKVAIEDEGLRKSMTALTSGWNAFAAAMVELGGVAGTIERARELEGDVDRTSLELSQILGDLGRFCEAPRP